MKILHKTRIKFKRVGDARPKNLSNVQKKGDGISDRLLSQLALFERNVNNSRNSSEFAMYIKEMDMVESFISKIEDILKSLK